MQTQTENENSKSAEIKAKRVSVRPLQAVGVDCGFPSDFTRPRGHARNPLTGSLQGSSHPPGTGGGGGLLSGDCFGGAKIVRGEF